MLSGTHEPPKGWLVDRFTLELGALKSISRNLQGSHTRLETLALILRSDNTAIPTKLAKSPIFEKYPAAHPIGVFPTLFRSKTTTAPCVTCRSSATRSFAVVDRIGRDMRYEGKLYRPPSEAHSYILQATIGCSWNKCTYCDMYRDKAFRVRELSETLEDIALAKTALGDQVEKVFVADGDALVMDMDHWEVILSACRDAFPRLRQVSCYAMATNVTGKSVTELTRLRELGLSLLYIGPETGDPQVFKRIAKGQGWDEHVEAAQLAKAAGMRQSVIFLLGAAGRERSDEHALASARLATAMDPEYLAALTLTVVPEPPLAKLRRSGRFELPDVAGLLAELRTFVAHAEPTDALFRTNHASNHLPMAGRLPRDRTRIVEVIDAALGGHVRLRSERLRGL